MKKKKNEIGEQQTGKRSPKKSSKAGFTQFCAFWGVTFAALLFLTNGILQLSRKYLQFNPQNLDSWMLGIDFVSKLALLIAVGIPAYGYVNNKKIGWKIVYILSIVFYACFCVYKLF